MEFGDAAWWEMVAGTVAALHVENGYPLTPRTAGMLFLQARELGWNADNLRTWLLTQPRPVPVPQPVPVPVPVPTPVPTPTPQPGGPMPNRSVEVRHICEAHPETFQQPDDDALNAARLKLLRTVMIPQLNQMDGGGWGLLKKTDQGGKIPVDILCWAPGNRYADVMTGSGANWQEWDNPRPGVWIWTAA